MAPSTLTTSIAFGRFHQRPETLFGLPARCDVMGDTAHAGGRSGPVALDPAARCHPPGASIRPHDAEVLLEVICPLGQRRAHAALDTHAILGMHAFQETVQADRLIRLVTEQLTAFGRHPDAIERHIPLPQPELARAGGKLQALLALAQALSLTRSRAVRPAAAITSQPSS